MTSPLFPDLVVNGETVPQALIAAETQNHQGPKGKPGIVWRKAANALAVRTLLLQEARRRGITPDPAEVGPGRFETDDEALIRALLDDAIGDTAPDDDAIRAEWARVPERYLSPPLWEVSHILCACDPRDEAAVAKARTLAEGLARQAGENPRGFARLAREASDCGSAASGGALGQLCPGDTVPEFEAVLRDMTEGQITAEPVLTRHGWHVIRMDACAGRTPLPFEAAKPKIVEAMEKAAWATAAQTLVRDLVARAEISGAELQAGRIG